MLYFFRIISSESSYSVKQKLRKVFNSDQVQALEHRDRGTQWRADTVKKALQLRYACGAQGYEFLRQCGHPVPAYCTLCRRVQHVDMTPGVDQYLIDMLATKLAVYNAGERECCMLIDEVQFSRSWNMTRDLND